MSRCAVSAIALLVLFPLLAGCQSELIHLNDGAPQTGEFTPDLGLSSQPTTQPISPQITQISQISINNDLCNLRNLRGISPVVREPDLNAVESAVLEKLEPAHFVVRHTEHFALFTKAGSGSGAAWSESAAGLLDAFYTRFMTTMREGGFEGLLKAPGSSSRLIWVCLPTRDEFDRYVKATERTELPWLDGFYSARTNRVTLLREEDAGGNGRDFIPASRGSRPGLSASSLISLDLRSAVRPVALETPVIDLGGQPVQPGESAGGQWIEALHEAGHQLSFNCRLLKRGVMYPLWVTEGVATNFEAGSPAGPGSDNPIRCPQLAAARAAGTMPALAELAIATCTRGDDDASRDTYAAAWALFRFLFQKHGSQLTGYLAALAALPPGQRPAETLRAEFVRAFGPIQELQPHWETFLGELTEAQSAPRLSKAAPTLNR